MFKDGSRALGYAIASIAAAALLTLIAIYAFGGVSQLTAPFRGETDKKDRTTGSGAFRIATYEEFFDLCAGVQTAEQQIKALTDELHDTAQPPTPERAEKIRTSLTAVRSSRAESIATYNSKATQEHRTAFHDAALPYKLDPAAEETQCAA
ncbi:hypothetical protein RM863_29220 [Streptomyces sp. DSM 41014]|uniref:Uncharacterized protein n=1 Tax=Streptomyces hintoniae TaxID=3075521 RepID=A0ABU2USG0_9ACTN|nr:hypothetical protein [Streptomyces sp. DSM 41014]MDT0476213.1 hypothetical protein [Streptomyces sp. DSM 41014]